MSDNSLAWMRTRPHNYVGQIIDKHRITVLHQIRRGPRFFVASVNYRGRKGIFKISLKPNDSFLNGRFGREIEFLKYTNALKQPLCTTLPTIYEGEPGPIPWYIREQVGGKSYDINNSDIVFSPDFFSKKIAGLLKQNLVALHRIRPASLTPTLRRSFVVYDRITTKISFLRQAENYTTLKKQLGSETLGRLLEYLSANKRVYDRAPGVLTHHELFPPHFFTQRNNLKIIDWENVTWANPLRDWVTLWIRGEDHPRWQDLIKKAAQQDTRQVLKKNFHALWNMVVLIDALYIMTSYKTGLKRGPLFNLIKYSRYLAKKTDHQLCV